MISDADPKHLKTAAQDLLILRKGGFETEVVAAQTFSFCSEPRTLDLLLAGFGVIGGVAHRVAPCLASNWLHSRQPNANCCARLWNSISPNEAAVHLVPFIPSLGLPTLAYELSPVSISSKPRRGHESYRVRTWIPHIEPYVHPQYGPNIYYP